MYHTFVHVTPGFDVKHFFGISVIVMTKTRNALFVTFEIFLSNYIEYVVQHAI